MGKTTVTADARNGRIIASFGEFQGVLTWNFTNGEAMEFDASKAIRVTDDDIFGTLPDIAKKAMLHGFKQKISDAGAMSRDQATGLPPSASDRIAKMRRVVEGLARGEWELERTGGGGGGDSVLVRALAERFNKPADVIRPWLKAKTSAERTALRADKTVAKIITRIEAEAGKTSGVDTSALFAELDGV